MTTLERIGIVLRECRFPDWTITVSGNEEHAYLQVSFLTVCARTGGAAHCAGRKWQLSPHMTRSEIVQTAFAAVLAAQEHETRERFTYRGKPIFGPHFNIDRLVQLCEDPSGEDVRS